MLLQWGRTCVNPFLTISNYAIQIDLLLTHAERQRGLSRQHKTVLMLLLIILFRFGHGFLVINKSTLTFKNATLISATLHANRRNGILTAFWDGMTTLDGFQTVIFLDSLSLAVGRFFRRQPVGS